MHWPTRQLGEIFEIARGGSPRPIEKFFTTDANGLNWIKIGDATGGGKYIRSTKEKIRPEGLNKTRFVNAGDFLLTNSMSFGRPYILATDGCIHDGWLVLKPQDRSQIDQDYFYHVLSSDAIYQQFAARAGGSTVKNLNTEIVASVEIALPPLDEQRRIAAILDKADALRRKRKRALDLIDSLTQSIFLEMFGDPSSNSKGWETVRLSSICKKITDGTHDTPIRFDSGVPFITGKNVRPGAIDLSILEYVDQQTHEEIFRRCNPEIGDILYVNIGAGVGNAAINRLRYPFSMKNVALLKLHKDAVSPDYIATLLNLSRFKEGILGQNSKGGAQKFLSLSMIKGIRVPLPPFAMTSLFAERLRKLDKSVRNMERSMFELGSAFDSLQSRAFSGQL